MMLSYGVLAALINQCAPEISPVTMHSLIQTESGGYPYVVANISDSLSQYFNNKEKAINYINDLEHQGKTYSAGLMQIYSKNFETYGIDNVSVFDPCTNIKAGAKLLTENYQRQKGENEQHNLRKSLSLYYSGNEITGFKKEKKYGNTSYVERVEKKAYKVPEIKPSDTVKDSVEDNPKIDKTDTHTWDVFGDFHS